MVGPMAGAKVAVMANSAMPIGRCGDGSRVRISVNAIGISTPPVKPWMAAQHDHLPQIAANAQAIENSRNSTALASRKRRNENTRLR